MSGLLSKPRGSYFSAWRNANRDIDRHRSKMRHQRYVTFKKATKGKYFPRYYATRKKR